MHSETTILSILDRYEKNQPVSVEEKAVLHTWLVKKLRKEHIIIFNPTPMKIKKIRRRIQLWQYVFIILTLLTILITLYMFATKKGNGSTRISDDHVHSYYPAIWKAGRENRLDLS